MPPPKYLTSDDKQQTSRTGDEALSLSDVLRNARREKQFSQEQLAQKLGLGQRQISDLERAVSDSRISTVQNVARALDLELMLIPRHLIATVEALQRSGADAAKRPLYALGDEAEKVDTDAARAEVGGPSPSHKRSPR